MIVVKKKNVALVFHVYPPVISILNLLTVHQNLKAFYLKQGQTQFGT